MAAYYHIMSPFSICVEDKPALLKQFEEQYGNYFVHVDTYRVERFSPLLPDGNRLDFSYNEKRFELPKDRILAEFEAFATAIYTEWRDLYTAKFKAKLYEHTYDAEKLPALLAQIKGVLTENAWNARKLKEILEDIDENRGFYVEQLAPYYVYSGYPLEIDGHTDLSAFSFLHGYEKMDVMKEEYTAFYLLVERMKEKYENQFMLAKYLFIAGF